MILLISCKPKTPVLTTYSVRGEIMLINECNGNGSINPTSAQIFAGIKYKDGGSNTFVKNVPLVLQADGVTSIGVYAFSDLPTTSKPKHWDITFPNLCQYITPCPQVSQRCVNVGTTNIMPVKITQMVTTINKRYACVCN